jgi:hypothetical protein
MSILRNVRLAGAVLGILLIALAICLAPTATQAQSLASVSGTVTDTTGAAVPGATITVLDTRTNTTYFGKTAGDGSYRIENVPPGPAYSLTVKKDGFEVYVVNNLYLPIGTATTQDVKLEIGAVSSKVEVTAEGSVTLNTTDTTIGNSIDQHALAALPNEFRDNPANLLRLEVGVVSATAPPNDANSAIPLDPNLSRDGAVAGARTDQGNIVVDGIDASNIASGFAFATVGRIPIDAIQEFTTIVGNPIAEYGGRSGAQTLISTKSGTNSWHGSAYEYNRNAATEANNFFNQVSDPIVPRLALIRNQFGGNVGGAAIKDKAFFFFEYDGRRDREGASQVQIVPMAHVKLGELAYYNTSQDGNTAQGDCFVQGSRLGSADVATPCISILPASAVTALDPCSHTSCAATPGFQAPGVDPTLLSLFASRYPNPNDFGVGDGLNTAGFRFNTPNPLTENDYLARADFNLTGSNRLFVRFNFTNVTSLEALNQFPGDPLTSPDLVKDRAWVLSDSWVLTPNLVNKFTYGETRENDADPILFNPAGGLFELSFDDGISTPFLRQSAFGTLAPEPTFRDDITWVHGKHAFSFGGQWNPIIISDQLTNDFNFIQQGLGAGNLSSLDASLRPADINQDSANLTNWDAAFVGNLGSIANSQASINYTGKGVALPSGSNVKHDYRINEIAGYASDSWKARPSLTITLGLRYQYQSVPYETSGVQASVQNTNFRTIVDTRIANGLAGIAGPDSTPLLTYSLTGKVNHAAPMYNPDYREFSPRLGFAWNPSFHDGLLGKLVGDRKTVIRAGASIIFDDTAINNIVALQNQGDYTFGGSAATTFGATGVTPEQNLILEPRFNSVSSSPVPVVAPPFVTPVTPTAIFNYDIDNQFRTPYAFITSFGVQRELPAGLQFEADYYGRFNRKLFTLADAGQLMDFTDPESKQTLAQAYTQLELAAQGKQAFAPQPFFEDEFGAGTSSFIFANGSDLLAEGNPAFLSYDLGFSGTNIGLTPQFAVNALATNLGSSSYNALFVSLRKRLSNNLQFDFDYTFSHSIDNNSTVPHANGNFEPGVTTILCDATNPNACRGNSEFDATHQVTAYFVYDLPFGRGQRFGHNVNRLVDEAIGGWEISGIETWRTGLAIEAQSGVGGTTSLAADPGSQFIGPRSALARDIHIIHDESGNTIVQYFKDPTAAMNAFEPVLGLGVGTRDNLRGPHFSDLDVSVSKNFPLWSERYKLRFVAEAYNVFNHTNFGIYDPTLSSTTTFGTFSSEAGTEPSRVMQFALRFDF